jgi:DNA polymerase-3 subunit epsilon
VETFVAIDFETADTGRDSACALGVVRVEGGVLVRSEARLIRPPRRDIFFTYIHGITWEMVEDAPVFGEVWAELEPILEGAEFLVAHNASIDRNVLAACCAMSGRTPPPQPFHCTVRLARKLWNIRPTRLPDVCSRFDIALRHHDARSDAEACARIMVEALRAGAGLPPGCNRRSPSL